MSTKLTFSVLSERQAGTPADRQGPFASSDKIVLRRNGPIERPVHVARTLKAFGLDLGEAHRALNRIVADEPVVLSLDGADRDTMIVELAQLGVAAE